MFFLCIVLSTGRGNSSQAAIVCLIIDHKVGGLGVNGELLFQANLNNIYSGSPGLSQCFLLFCF